MTGLEKVSLKKNQIRNIDEGAIGLLQKLSRIDLSANPVVCNCHLLGLLKSLKEGNIEATLNETFCDSPTRLQGRSLNSLDPKELICEIGFEAQRACSSEDGGNCPRGCLCSGTSVRCSRSKLEDIPEGISEDTTELFLDGNKIKHLTFRNLTKLKKLYFSIILRFSLKIYLVICLTTT
jgi:Leucine-rich repeat (LRR) protein